MCVPDLLRCMDGLSACVNGVSLGSGDGGGRVVGRRGLSLGRPARFVRVDLYTHPSYRERCLLATIDKQPRVLIPRRAHADRALMHKAAFHVFSVCGHEQLPQRANAL